MLGWLLCLASELVVRHDSRLVVLAQLNLDPALQPRYTRGVHARLEHPPLLLGQLCDRVGPGVGAVGREGGCVLVVLWR